MASRSDEAVLEAARQQLAEAVPLAINVLREIAALSDKDTARIAASNSLLDRAGIVKPQQISVTVDAGEHARADFEANELIARLDRNRAALESPQPSLEAIVIHEGVLEDDELPLAVEYPDALDV